MSTHNEPKQNGDKFWTMILKFDESQENSIFANTCGFIGVPVGIFLLFYFGVIDFAWKKIEQALLLSIFIPFGPIVTFALCLVAPFMLIGAIFFITRFFATLFSLGILKALKKN